MRHSIQPEVNHDILPRQAEYFSNRGRCVDANVLGGTASGRSASMQPLGDS
jgi:hypothetical protein